MGMGLLNKIKSLKTYLEIFESTNDILKFKNVYKNKNAGDDLVSVRVKETLDHPLFIRPSTSDAQVLWDTFYRKYHLPEKLGIKSIIVDLGSNVGYTMAHFAFLYPESKIIGVELDKENFLLAGKNLESIKNKCELINAGIWSKSGTINYEGTAEWGYKISDTGKDKAVSLTMNDLLKKFNLKKIDFLKVDIEGAENDVFKNPEEWIDKVEQLKMEIHPPATIEGMSEKLTKMGFKVSKDRNHPSAINAIKINS